MVLKIGHRCKGLDKLIGMNQKLSKSALIDILRVDHGHDKRKECQLRVSATALHSIRVCGPAEIDFHTFQHE